MSDDKLSEEIKFKKYLREHCEQARVSDEFRRELLNKTTEIVGSHNSHHLSWRLIWLPGSMAAAVLTTFLVIQYFSGVLPVKPAWAAQFLAVTSIRGRVTLASGNALKLGDRVSIGTIIRTGRDGRVTLVTRRGSLLHLNSNSELTVGAGGNIDVAQGRLYCSNKMHELKQIDTPGGKVKLLGTVVDTEIIRKDAAAVTVVEGKVELSNDHGDAVVDAGKRAVLSAADAPKQGLPVNTTAETAWYDGRNKIASDTGEIVYVVRRAAKPHLTQGAMLYEIWAMKADGSGKHRIITYAGQFWADLAGWCPGSQWVVITTRNVQYLPIDHSWTGSRVRLLNVTTGQDVPLEIPSDYQVLFNYIALSPDCRYLAFVGHRGTVINHEEGGLWLYDLQTGKIKKMLDGWLQAIPSWSPDGRYIAISEGSYDLNHPVDIIDTQSDNVRRLSINGAGAAMSPDGTKLVYCGDFRESRTTYFHGIPASSSVMVMDITKGGEPKRITPLGEGALEPRWSPDGTRILYHTITHRNLGDDENSYTLYITKSDGSEIEKIYSGKGLLQSASWGPDGRTVYANIMRGKSPYGCSVISVDSNSEEIRNLGGDEDDSILTDDELKQTRNASTRVDYARFYYEAGVEYVFEGRFDRAREYFNMSADTLNEVAWRFPLAKLGMVDLNTCADIATQAALMPESKLLEICCEQRMRILFVGHMKSDYNRRWNYPRFPAELPAILDDTAGNWPKTAKNYGETWGGKPARIDQCPGKKKSHPVQFTYIPPTANSKVGDVVIKCPNHPDHCIRLDEPMLATIKRQFGVKAK